MQYIKFVKSCLYSICEVDTSSLSTFLGTCSIENLQDAAHSWTNDTAFSTDIDLTVKMMLLGSNRGQPISFVIWVPHGAVNGCRPLNAHNLLPLEVSQQTSRSPYLTWSEMIAITHWPICICNSTLP